MRVDAVLVVAGAAVLGGLVVSAPLAVVVAAVALGTLLAPRIRGRALALAGAAFITSAARGSLSVPAFEAELGRVRAALGPPGRCSGVARVETSPAFRGDALGYVVRFESLDCEGRRIGAPRVRLHGGPAELARGDRVEPGARRAPG